jgi:hypothetical protein
MLDKKELYFSDNCIVATSKDTRNEFLSLYIDRNKIIFTRYVVPGRYDLYSFRYDITERIYRLQYFSDCDYSLRKSLNMFERDLKKLKIKQLIETAKKKNDLYNRLLNYFLEYFLKKLKN